MRVQNRVFQLLGVFLIAGSLFGCASKSPNNEVVCNGLASPNSNNIYFYVDNEDSSLEKVVKVLEKNTTLAFLNLSRKVNIVSDLKDVGSEGVLIQVDSIAVDRGMLAKRVAILYRVINVETNEVMLNDKASIGSIRGYNKATRGLGKVVSRQVSNLMTCFESRGNVSAKIPEPKS